MNLRFVTLSESDRTRLRILEAIDRPIDSMSIKELSEKAGISRQTFYNHFSDKHDIVSWYGVFLARNILSEIGRSLTWEEGLRAYLEAIIEHQSAFALAAGSPLLDTEYMRGQKQSASMRSAILQEQVVARKGAALSEDEIYVIDAWALLEGRLMTMWIQEGCHPEPAVLAGRLAQCVPPFLQETLSLA